MIRPFLYAVERSRYSASLEERLGQPEWEHAELQTELRLVCQSLDETETEVLSDVVAELRTDAQEVLDTGNAEDVRALLRAFIVRIEVEDH